MNSTSRLHQLIPILLALLLGAAGTAAQGDPPMQGPLLASAGPDNISLILLDLSSGNQRELTFGQGDHWFGSFAPDGCRFTFVMSGPGGDRMRLYSARLDGSDLRELLTYSDQTGATSWEAWSPQWSPAGDLIAFVMIRDYEQNGERSRTTHIGRVSAEGGTPAMYSISGTEGAPTWSPDGGWLVYTSSEKNAVGRLENDLWVVSADGSNKYQLTAFPAGSTIFPLWSPNGEVISFIYAPSGNNHQFWTTPASGGTVQQWSTTWTLVLDYDWLPDGSGLVAAIKDWQGNDDNRLWRVPLPGNADTDATLFLDQPEATAVDYPAFSPDGRYLAFRSAYSAMLYDTATGELRELPSFGMSNSPLIWSPPGFTSEAACS